MLSVELRVFASGLLLRLSVDLGVFASGLPRGLSVELGVFAFGLPFHVEYLRFAFLKLPAVQLCS